MPSPLQGSAGHTALMQRGRALCREGRSQVAGATLEAADLTVQLLVQPLVSKDSFIHPPMQQALPHSFLSSAGSSLGASPWPSTG